MFPYVTGDGGGRQAQLVGTRIRSVVGGGIGFSHIASFSYTDGGTIHDITLMRGASRASVVGPVAAGGTTLILNGPLTDGDSNVVVAGDVIAVQLDNGEWHLATVTTWTPTTNTVVIAPAVPAGRIVPDTVRLVCYGSPADLYHARFMLKSGGAAGVAKVWPTNGVSYCKASRSNEPIVIDSNNVGVAGAIDFACVGQTMQ